MGTDVPFCNETRQMAVSNGFSTQVPRIVQMFGLLVTFSPSQTSSVQICWT